MSVILALSILSCCAVFFSAVTLAAGMKKIGRLDDVEPGPAKTSSIPLVSIVVPACNEEANIEKALLTLLAQDYPNLEIIAVNDRSTDRTGQLMQRIQSRNRKLKVHEIKELPDGWMGKSHALAAGAKLAKGGYLVFTDADVIMEKTTISRALRHITQNKLDHLTLVFGNISDGWLLNCLILDSGMGILLLFRPWAAKKKKSRAFAGIGAFNMVKKEIYNAIGGHEKIKMHPIDDMMLGKIIKTQGFNQDCLLAYDYITVPWYSSVTDMVNGLQKNIYAVLHFRLLLVPVVLFIVVTAAILPIWGALFTQGLVQILCLATTGIRFAAFYGGLRMQGLPAWYLPGCIITPYISLYILLKSVIVTLRSRGIVWRGHHYELEEMKKNDPILY